MCTVPRVDCIYTEPRPFNNRQYVYSTRPSVTWSLRGNSQLTIAVTVLRFKLAHSQQSDIHCIYRIHSIQDRVITMAPSVSGRLNPVALVYPKNPLNLSVPVVNISPLLVEVGLNEAWSLIFDLFSRREIVCVPWEGIRISSIYPSGTLRSSCRLRSDLWSLMISTDLWSPESASSRIDRECWPWIHLSSLSAISSSFHTMIFDLFPISRSASISIERSKSDVITNFPFTKDGRHPYDLRSFTGSRDHVCYLVFDLCLWFLMFNFWSQLGLVVSHRCSANSWRTVVGSITDRLSRVIYSVISEKETIISVDLLRISRAGSEWMGQVYLFSFFFWKS